LLSRGVRAVPSFPSRQIKRFIQHPGTSKRSEGRAPEAVLGPVPGKVGLIIFQADFSFLTALSGELEAGISFRKNISEALQAVISFPEDIADEFEDGISCPEVRLDENEPVIFGFEVAITEQ
jgi:hypothetical protein